MKTSLSFVFILFTALVKSQDPCDIGNHGYVFQANRIGAFFNPRGTKFLDDKINPFFKVPYTSEKSASTIFASSPWIGGYVNGTLKLAGTIFMTHDYYVGPLGPGAVPYTECLNFDKVWSVSRGEIEQHIQDYMADGIIQDTFPDVFGWPAQGNVFFHAFNGFDLPSDHIGGWADFTDLNHNGVYEPQSGEYPQITLMGHSQNPELIAWMVFNDQGPHHVSEGLPLGVEIQLTVFAFLCNDSKVLNNTLFNTYKIINQSQNTIDSLYFGMWSDYDLGCSTDDYFGCDSVRNTEFVYSDVVDGDVNTHCSNGAATYGYYPPVQSYTYLSHPMHSFIVDVSNHGGDSIYPDFMNAKEQYNLLTGNWADGTAMYASGYGIHNSQDGPLTKYYLHGDPRDTAQWSWISANLPFRDLLPVSSVYLNRLQAGEQVTVETAYSFHQDSTLNNLQQVGFMYQNIDSLLEIIEDLGSFCHPPLACVGKDCVWPGDFNHNGIADHFDILYWGVMLDSIGGRRDGLINWAGHSADAWNLILPDNLNSKHGDGNGDGKVTIEDLERNIIHFLLTNPYYKKMDSFPEGPEVLITAREMDEFGNIGRINIETGLPLDNILGMAYELDFDTTLYYIKSSRFPICPSDSNIVCIGYDGYEPEKDIMHSTRYAFVKTDHVPLHLDQHQRFEILIQGIALKDSLTLDDVPDTVLIRLKNLIALDPNGNDLHIGANTLKVPNYLLTGTTDPGSMEYSLFIYPNPTDKTISIVSDLATDMHIFNLQGQLVKSISEADLNHPIDISSFSPGVYIIQALESGLVAKFIKQ